MSWNVNSIRSRLPLVSQFLEQERPHVLALQETRCNEAQFPFESFAQLGYESAHLGTRGHGGVALLSAIGLDRVSYGFGGEHGPPFDEPRLVSADIAGLRLINVYAPNGRTMGSSAWEVKLAWFELLRIEVALEMEESANVLVMGDFNICPRPEDVYDPVKKRNRNLVSEPERLALQRLVDLGLSDLGRHFHPDETQFTWFAHAAGQFEKNRGYRLDLALGSEATADQAIDCVPLLEWRRPELRPSDHAPLLLALDET